MRGVSYVRVLLLVSIPGFFPTQGWAFLGTEMGPLLQLVSGQVTEIERLAQNIDAIRDQTRVLRDLNEGASRTVSQIENLQAILERAQGLDPKSIKSLSDLGDLLERAKQSQQAIEQVTQVKVDLADQAIASSALQGDTAYRMGQEMVATGSVLTSESKSASPGRANQINAAAGSAQMLASGVQLQTLAQIVQLQALTLEFHKSQVERELSASKQRRQLYERQLGAGTAGAK